MNFKHLSVFLMLCLPALVRAEADPVELAYVEKAIFQLHNADPNIIYFDRAKGPLNLFFHYVLFQPGRMQVQYGIGSDVPIRSCYASVEPTEKDPCEKRVALTDCQPPFESVAGPIPNFRQPVRIECYDI